MTVYTSRQDWTIAKDRRNVSPWKTSNGPWLYLPFVSKLSLHPRRKDRLCQRSYLNFWKSKTKKSGDFEFIRNNMHAVVQN